MQRSSNEPLSKERKQDVVTTTVGQAPLTVRNFWRMLLTAIETNIANTASPRSLRDAPVLRTRTIGYLVPQWPAQTHNFFWREVASLKALDTCVRFVRRGVRLTPSGRRRGPMQRSERQTTSFRLAFAGCSTCWQCSRPYGSEGFCKLSISWDEPKVKISLADFDCCLACCCLCVLRRLRVPEAGRTYMCIHVRKSANIALFANRLFGTSYSLTLHNPIGVYGGNQKAKFRYARFAIFITEPILQEAKALLGEAFPLLSSVAPMGVDGQKFMRRKTYIAFDGSGSFRIFCCARLNPAKGHGVLVEAAALARAQGVPIVVDIAGEDDDGGTGYRRELERCVARYGAADYIRLLGAVSEDIVLQHLERCHCFVLASLNEPLGVAIMEAMAMSVPVIATRAGGVPSLVDHGNNGLLVEPNDPAALSLAIIELANDPHFARELASRSREKVLRDFTSDVSARAIANHLRS